MSRTRSARVRNTYLCTELQHKPYYCTCVPAFKHVCVISPTANNCISAPAKLPQEHAICGSQRPNGLAVCPLLCGITYCVCMSVCVCVCVWNRVLVCCYKTGTKLKTGTKTIILRFVQVTRTFISVNFSVNTIIYKTWTRREVTGNAACRTWCRRSGLFHSHIRDKEKNVVFLSIIRIEGLHSLLCVFLCVRVCVCVDVHVCVCIFADKCNFRLRDAIIIMTPPPPNWSPHVLVFMSDVCVCVCACVYEFIRTPSTHTQTHPRIHTLQRVQFCTP